MTEMIPSARAASMRPVSSAIGVRSSRPAFAGVPPGDAVVADCPGTAGEDVDLTDWGDVADGTAPSPSAAPPQAVAPTSRSMPAPLLTSLSLWRLRDSVLRTFTCISHPIDAAMTPRQLRHGAAPA